MKNKEYGAWPPWNVGPGGKNKSHDEFNRAMKGGGFPRKYGEEYANSNIEEYHRYSERNDSFAEQQKKKRDDPKSEEAKKSKAQKKNRIRDNLIKQVAGLAVGSVIIVTSYQARVERLERERGQDTEPAVVTDDVGPDDTTPGGDDTREPEVTIVSVEWVWDEETGEAKAVLLDSAGAETEVPATVTVNEVTYCAEPGVRTYLAVVTDGKGNEYTDEREEELPATGHTPEEIVVSPNESRYRCTVCGEELEKIEVDYEPET